MSIRFLLDENMPFALLEFLRNKNSGADHLKKLIGDLQFEIIEFIH